MPQQTTTKEEEYERNMKTTQRKRRQQQCLEDITSVVVLWLLGKFEPYKNFLWILQSLQVYLEPLALQIAKDRCVRVC